MHLPDDLCLIEPVDAAGHPTAPGSPSQRIYVTNLYNHALPLVRFEVTDELTESGANCPCGSALRRIQDPQGRLDDTFVYRGGLSVHPHLFRSPSDAIPRSSNTRSAKPNAGQTSSSPPLPGSTRPP